MTDFQWAVPHEPYYPLQPKRPMQKMRMMQMVLDSNNDAFTYSFATGKLTWRYFAHLLKLP